MNGIDKQKLAELKAFITLLEQKPEVLHAPELEFFRAFLERHGAKIPTFASHAPKEPRREKDKREAGIDEPQISEDEVNSIDEESFPEDSQDSEIMTPEAEELPPLAPEGEKELSDADFDKLAALKQSAATFVEDGNYLQALEKLNEALAIGNPSALMYCKRADILLKLNRPLACIRDCDEALKLNPDNGKAYRLRGKAHRFLGNWEDAHRDLETGQKIDYDESLEEIQKLVAEKWAAIETAHRVKNRRREERTKRNKLRQRRRQQAAAKKAYEEEKAREADEDCFAGTNGIPGGIPGMGGMPGGMGGMPGGMGGMPGGMGGMPGGMGGMPGAGGMGGMPGGANGGLGGLGGLLGGLMGNPEMKKAMSNPKVLQAVMEMMQNPAAFSKYQNDPEVMAAFNSLMSSMGGAKAGAAP